MSPAMFYLALVFFSDSVEFSFLWLMLALVFGGTEHKYRYTTNPALEGKDV